MYVFELGFHYFRRQQCLIIFGQKFELLAIVFYNIEAAEALHCVSDVTFMFNSGLKCFQIELRSV